MYSILFGAVLMFPRAGGGERPDHEMFFLSVADLAEQADGLRFGYRSRRVSFDCDGETSQPTKIWDGVTRISFHRDFILTDEVQYEMAAAKSELPTPRRVVTYYSLSSGEYARSTLLAGSALESVVLGHWSILPQIAYFSLGTIGNHAYLEGCGPAELEVDARGVHCVSFSNPTGATLHLTYDLEQGGEIQFVRADHPDGYEHDWTSFQDCVPQLPGGPLRPTLVTSGRVTSDGRVRQVFAWSSIGGEWAEEDWNHEVPSRAGVMDFRGAEGEIPEVRTDRPVMLGDLLSWPYPLDERTPEGSTVYQPRIVEIAGGRGGTTVSLLIGAGLIVAAITLGLRRSRI
jgi:hypothetical protein